MPWVQLRETANLVGDPLRRGRPASDIPDGERLPVNTLTGAVLDHQGTIELMVWWLDANDRAVFAPLDDDTLVVEPVHIGDLGPGEQAPRLLVGEASTFTSAAYRPLRLDLAPRGLVSLRLTDMAVPGAVPAATHAAVFYWSKT